VAFMVNFYIEDIIKQSKNFYSSLNPFFKISIIIICIGTAFLAGIKVGEPIGRLVYYVFH